MWTKSLGIASYCCRLGLRQAVNFGSSIILKQFQFNSSAEVHPQILKSCFAFSKKFLRFSHLNCFFVCQYVFSIYVINLMIKSYWKAFLSIFTFMYCNTSHSNDKNVYQRMFLNAIYRWSGYSNVLVCFLYWNFFKIVNFQLLLTNK